MADNFAKHQMRLLASSYEQLVLAEALMAAVRLLGDVEAKENGNNGLSPAQKRQLFKQVGEAAQVARRVIINARD